MGNLINLPNIKPEAFNIEDNAPTTRQKPENGFDTKNYLNVRLDKDQTSKTLTIRLLPMDLETGSPFIKVHTHNVKVPLDVSPSGYKSYLCLAKNKDIDHEKFGSKCPFCEMNKRAYDESMEATDPVEQKTLRKISVQNLSHEAVIVRCIERGKEEEGVKFWKFNIRLDKTDPYNQIVNLYNLRKAEGAAEGVETNILDIYNGVDLTVTITEGNSAPTIMDCRSQKPLSKDEEEMKKWIYDEKKWQDVFATKPYEYLALISEMKTPWFDRDNNMWVDKEEYDKIHNASDDTSVETAENELIANAEKQVEAQAKTAEPAKEKTDIVSQITVADDDSDLPF